MPPTNNLLFAVGNISTPQEGAAALMTSVVIQAFHDVQDVSLSREERREACDFMMSTGNRWVKDTVGKVVPMDLLVTC